MLAQEKQKEEKTDVITLNNGRTLEGKLILEDHQKDEYKLQISENHILFLRASEIKEIRKNVLLQQEKATKVRNSFVYPDKKFFAQIHIGLLAGREPDWSWEESKAIQNLAVYGSYGYVYKPWLQAGIGTGLLLLDRGSTLPAFLEIRGDLTPTQVTPYYEVRAGYHFPLYNSVEFWGEEFEDANVEGSFLYSAALGIQLYTQSSYAFNLSLGFQNLSLSHTFPDPWREEGSYKDAFTYKRLSIQAGIRF
ncbi:MAG: hypothetical protein AAF388_01750 [Bacteroidota bacterium]